MVFHEAADAVKFCLQVSSLSLAPERVPAFEEHLPTPATVPTAT